MALLCVETMAQIFMLLIDLRESWSKSKLTASGQYRKRKRFACQPRALSHLTGVKDLLSSRLSEVELASNLVMAAADLSPSLFQVFSHFLRSTSLLWQ